MSSTDQSVQSGPRTYGGWQPERVHVAFGLSPRRAVLLGAAVLAGVWPLIVSRLSAGVLTWPVSAILLLAVYARVAGRTADEWALALISYGWLRSRRQHRYAANVTAGRKPSTVETPTPPDLPGVLAPLRILEIALAGNGTLAVAYHPIDRTVTAVAAVRYPGLGLSDSARAQQRVAGWGALLGSLCVEGTPIVRVQALHRLLPESGAALRRWHTQHLSPAAPPVAAQITNGLLATSIPATSRREAFLAFTMDIRRTGRAIRGAGGGATGAAVVLSRHLQALTGSVAAADLHIDSWLGPRDLAEVIRVAYDPAAARPLAERRAAATGAPGDRAPNGSPARDRHPARLAPGITPDLAGPGIADAQPGVYRHDGALSVAYCVYDWPRNEVYATALAPLLGEGEHRRALSLYLSPLGPREAAREVMHERTARSVAVAMRRKSGQVISEDERLALDRAHGQDAERAVGHGLVRFAGYVAVTVTDPSALDDACAAVEADAAAAGIELRRLWFAQDIGFAAAALPLGLGLSGRKR